MAKRRKGEDRSLAYAWRQVLAEPPTCLGNIAIFAGGLFSYFVGMLLLQYVDRMGQGMLATLAPVMIVGGMITMGLGFLIKLDNNGETTPNN